MNSTCGETQAGDAGTPPLPDEGGSVLVLAPAMDSRVDECCVRLACPDDPVDVDLLAVALDGGVDDVLDRWTRYAGATPGRTAVVTAGESVRGAAAASSEGVSMLGSDVSLASVSDPGDLTGLGIKISQCLSSWEDDDNDLMLCFDSLTTLLQFTELRQVFQFVHVLTQRIESAGARAHFHMNQHAHDEQTVATVRSLFDHVYELDADGAWRQR
ncbi:DUF7504 family protein [Halorarius litoreus]|uniref:DUF7504 family protein n=1 Tax=Halorarius litoreus TaxID=2962676 RepID=UPI0020CC71BE|nr:hypothetical protein [Halorarius litoreus]